MFHIMKTYLYNLDPLKPYFNIVKLGFTGVCIIFLISAKKWGGSKQYPTIYVFSKNMKYISFYLKIFIFWW